MHLNFTPSFTATYPTIALCIQCGTPPRPPYHLTYHLTHLTTPFTEKEIKDALLALPNGKTPGLDGLPKEFYTHYWNEIGPLLSMMIKEFQQGTVPSSLPKAATVLIF